MPLSLTLLIGILGMFLLLFFKNPIISGIRENNKLANKLREANWFQNPWLSGVFLFVMNAVLFFFTVFVIYVLMYFLIPFAHFFVMFMAVVGSIYLWIIINKACQGTERDRLKMGVIGSSFYLFITLIFVYWLLTLKPAYPGDDTFMGAVGLFFGIIVSVMAFTACLVITGFSRRKIAK